MLKPTQEEITDFLDKNGVPEEHRKWITVGKNCRQRLFLKTYFLPEKPQKYISTKLIEDTNCVDFDYLLTFKDIYDKIEITNNSYDNIKVTGFNINTEYELQKQIYIEQNRQLQLAKLWLEERKMFDD